MQHEHHRVPVTALSLWSNDILLSGEGTFLNAYRVSSRTLLRSLAIFDGQQIHGIVTDFNDRTSIVLLWGGQSICKVVAERDEDGSLSFHPGRVHQTSDWILDVALAPPADGHGSRAAILTAHNALAVWDLSDDGSEARLEPVVPGSNCILYSAQVQWLNNSKCLIAAGTAFGDVIVWSCLFSVTDHTLHAQPQTHYAFSAHEGSVFGVRLSSDKVAAAAGGKQHLLASCSDDRTIRLWDISDLSSASPTLRDIQRETGFSIKHTEDIHAPPCLCKAMAHASRIWHVRLTVEQASHKGNIHEVRLWSFGEDASYIIWRLESSRNADNATVYNLKQCQTKRPHHGKHIWSLDIDEIRGVVTGGADGAIVFSALKSEPDLQGRRLDLEALAENDGKLDRLKAYVFTGPNELVATTEQGRVLLLKLHSADDYTVRELSPPRNSLKGYSLLSGCSGIAFVAGNDGSVYVCLPATFVFTDLLQTDRKVSGLFSGVVSSATGTSQSTAVLTTNINSKNATFSTFVLQRGDTTSNYLTNVIQRQLCIKDPFVVTSFAVWRSKTSTHVVLGTRHGSLLVYDVTPEQSEPIPIKTSVVTVHGKEAITSLQFVRSSETSQDSLTLLSTGRDGTYAAHLLKLEENFVQVETVHQLLLPFGPNIEGMGHCPAGDLWIWGFRSTCFVVYSVQTEQETFVVDCGGAHRSWAFQPGDKGSAFIWTKASKTFCKWKEEASAVAITSNGHGRDIKTVSISPAPPHIIATGSEDTNIKLSTYHVGKFTGIHTLQKHNTGIQHLQWSDDGHYLFSSGGFEELFIWKITPGVPGIGIGVICESAHPESGKSDLRITTFRANSHPSSPSRTFEISALYSDSSIKLWRYDAANRDWTLLSSGEYLTACPTQCLDLSPESHSGFLTANTDGHLTAWTTPLSAAGEGPRQRLAWRHRRAVHQNAILSLAHRTLADDSVLVFSGGDDNALGVTRYYPRENLPLAPAVATVMVPRAHAAAVTGLVVFPGRRQRAMDGGDGSSESMWLVSAGIDQRVKLWRIEVDVGQDGVQGLEIRRCGSVFTSVADVAGLERIPLREGAEEGVLVVGVGMDVWRMDCLRH